MFFNVKTTEEVLEIIQGFNPVEEENIDLSNASGRVLGRDMISPEDLPGFPRSSMDGFAVRAKDTFGASESLPALLELKGEVLMGQIPAVSVESGTAIRISTGGMVPEGADAVVIIEHCHLLDETTLEVMRAASPQEHIIRPGDDFARGAAVLKKGWTLRPQDIGVMAGLGILKTSVHRRPRVAVISTGDEVIPIDRKPKPGEIRDINTYTLVSFCEIEGVSPLPLGLCRDQFDPLRELIERGLREADSVWISGGSSVGTRDMTVKVLKSFPGMELLVHGISVSPGKPTILARVDSKAVFGLPGHTASAMVIAEVFLKPFLGRLAGRNPDPLRDRRFVDAVLGRNIESASGREDYIRVKLVAGEEGWVAEPLFGKSGLISTLVEGDGLVRIRRNEEGLYRGDKVRVMIL
ncbi:MAG: molybdopterin molybdenumtransferase MoeA [Deltaproteobacteria bacterium HGW-Deltaproteobacteria-15]|nr:MAG: molybdopterin molybdenumtransferase MoeA [Deltaproteobacteria bacterium HGW-Deltaproteobacteria-15]